jgi:hypothetical protein
MLDKGRSLRGETSIYTVMLDKHQPVYKPLSDELQFGFKSGSLSCCDAIFALHALTNYIIANGSSVRIFCYAECKLGFVPH